MHTINFKNSYSLQFVTILVTVYVFCAIHLLYVYSLLSLSINRFCKITMSFYVSYLTNSLSPATVFYQHSGKYTTQWSGTTESKAKVQFEKPTLRNSPR